MYKIQDDVITKSNGFGNYYVNHVLADNHKARIESNWKQFKQRVIDAVIVATVTLTVLAVLTLTIGCASRQHNHQLHTQETVSNRYAVSATATTKSRSLSMALNSAKHRCRVELANKLNTEMLYNSRVVYQDISRSTDGLYYTATVVVAIPQ